MVRAQKEEDREEEAWFMWLFLYADRSGQMNEVIIIVE